MPAPRQLYIGPMYVFTEPLAKFGLYFGIIALAVTFVFLIVNPVTALFPMAFLAIAVGVGSAGWNAGRKRLRAWRYGKPAPAEIIWIGQDTSYRVNGKSPWMMRYQFSVGTETVTGTRKSFNESITNLRLHEKIWVVYLPENPAISAEWPPIP